MHFDATLPVTVLFIAAMFIFFVGLVYFLREIYVPTVSLRMAHVSKHPRETLLDSDFAVWYASRQAERNPQ